ncbi:MAG: glutathione S-transferase C-terminal domain-containing protein [Pseudomonadota bacterium]
MTDLVLWGVTASPYHLKMQAMLNYADLRVQQWPQQATVGAALRAAWHLRVARRARRVLRYPAVPTSLDEYPSVPYYTFDARAFYYDSSALARHLDALLPARPSLLPAQAATAFVCQLIDEALDEFGLYMVHHMRWVVSAHTNIMGVRTAAEMAPLLPPGFRLLLAKQLPRRQVRRCPYLFSVAPEGFDVGVESPLTPPSREGFPATHELLENAWEDYLAALEGLLAQQPFVLGPRFTLADAAVYGQLAMNLVDGVAAERLQSLAPRCYAWLCGIRDGSHLESVGEPIVTEALTPLIKQVGDTFVPLMQQNASAYQDAVAAGERVFNEAAFDAGRALYDGTLCGQPFRSVVKTFQVQVWRDLQSAWKALDAPAKRQLEHVLGNGTVAALADATR